jgi:apolipoprotein N-acyltransferase
MTGADASPAPAGARASWLGLGLTAVLLLASFPPLGHPFVAFLALVPAALAAAEAPDHRRWRRAAFGTSWLLWIALLAWLRHVYPPLGWLGLVALTAYCALYLWAWLLALRWLLPACDGAGLAARLLAMLGLAGAWGLLEWARGTFLTGFGWLPLAASQQGNPVMLTLCAWVGPTGLSMGLVLVNLGLASWIIRLRRFRRADAALTPLGPMDWARRLTPELYLGLAVIAAGFALTLTETARRAPRQVVRLAAVRTHFDPTEKWRPERLRQQAEALAAATATARAERPDLILWPEAALSPLLDEPGYAGFLRTQAAGTTLVVGAIERRGAGYANSVAAVTPEGVQRPTYAKRHLVPFGEYVPGADWLPLRKVVPIAEDCVAGQAPTLLPLTTREGFTYLAGPLVCYEDVFPQLAREHALAGADLLVVVTNDGWYGREAADAQHTAHSVLLAAATGLPVARAGNEGWTGVITPHGLLRPTGDGAPPVQPAEIRAPRGEATLWVRRGDWILGLGGLALAGAYVWRRRRSAP